MSLKTVAILSPGDMGHAVGLVLRNQGLEVVTCLAERGEETHKRAQKGGFRDMQNLKAVVSEADLVLSIVPPKAAMEVASQVGKAMAQVGKTPVYVDCNAISPKKSRSIGEIFERLGAVYTDAGIIGPPPGIGTPSIYVCGSDTSLMENLPGLVVISLGEKIGRASALKLCFSAFNKGINALITAVITAAESLDLTDELENELKGRQSELMERINKLIPFLPVNAARWVHEMEEIAETFEDIGITPDFHKGAAAIYTLLASTPFSLETRETFQDTRTASEVIKACVKAIEQKLNPDDG